MIRRLLLLARDSRIALAAALISGFLAGLLTIAQAAGLSRVVAGVFLFGWDVRDASTWLWILLLVVCLRSLLAWLSEISAREAAVRVKAFLRRQLFDRLLQLGPAYTRRERTGELVNTVVEGVEALDAWYSQYLPQLIIAALVPLSVLVFVFPCDPLSGLVLLLTAPLIPLLMVLIGKGAEKLTRRQWHTLSMLSAHFLDSLQGLATLKELGRSREQAASIAGASDRFRQVTLKVLRLTFLSALVLELIATLSTAVVAVEVSLRLLYGRLEFQPALFLLLLAPEFYLPLRMLGLRFHAGMSASSAARRIFSILDLEPVPGEPPPAVELKPVESLILDSVSFAYPGEAEDALQAVSLEIRAGENVAFVGASGAGKSTLAALLLGFIQPSRGQVLINNIPLNSQPLEAWRGQVSWVSQEPHLFHDTIAANLQLAKPGAADEELYSALHAAHLDDFVRSLPLGLATVVGEAGARLSGGQAQRLALARAFLKDAPVLILDEPTSSQDPLNEQLLDSSLRELMRGRTVITLAHRLNTVCGADRIYVLKSGCLVEQGTHARLLSAGGAYARLAASGIMVPGISAPCPTELPHAAAEGGGRFHAPDRDLTGPLPSKKPPTHTLTRLLGFLAGSWRWVVLSVLLGMLTVGSGVGLMGTSAFLLSSAALHPALGSLQVAIAGVRFFGIARGVFRYAERLATHDTTFRLLARLRTWFYRALEPLAPARLLHFRSGDLLAGIVADVDQLENFYVRAVAPPLVGVTVTAGMAVFLGKLSFSLAAAYLGFSCLLGIGVPALSWVINRRTGSLVVSHRAELQAYLVDAIRGLAEILVFNRRLDWSDRMALIGVPYDRVQRRLAVHYGISGALSVLLVNCCMLTVLLFAIPLVSEGQITGVMLAVVVVTALAGMEAVQSLPQSALALSSSLGSARRLFNVVDTEAEIRDSLPVPASAGQVTPSAHPGLAVEALTFTYPGQDQPALQEITFSLEPGKRIAFVGSSGAGKSTLVNLLLRFWEYHHGHIQMDGIDLRALPADLVRCFFSVASQRSHLFDDTIRRNLLLAKPEADELEMQAACRQAQVHDFIQHLPNDYDTRVNEASSRLSRGERQRLILARAFLKDAPILLLDEPTANLDTVTERALLDLLLASNSQHSLLWFTHRLVAMEQLDEICVLDRGRLVERGSHAQLLSRNGIYALLWDVQNRYLPSVESIEHL